MTNDMLMINAGSDPIEVSKRARALTGITGLMLVVWFAVMAVTPVNSSSDISTTPAAVQPAHESSDSESGLGRGSSIDDPVTTGVDMHG
jgi:hypothetical protein